MNRVFLALAIMASLLVQARAAEKPLREMILETLGTWARISKLRPQSMDEWTHIKYDASNNPVSTDNEMGMPDGIRWAAGPTWPTGYRKGAISKRVVSGKHLVYVFEDEIQAPDGPEQQWSLIVRDAFNGLLLWRKKTNPYRGLVSVGDLIYTAEGGNLAALETDTGRVTKTFRNVSAPDLLLHADGRLLSASMKRELSCLDPTSGRILWRLPMSNGKRIAHLNAADGRVFLSLMSNAWTEFLFKCLDLKTGREIWSKNPASWCKGKVELVFNQYGVLIASGDGATHGVSSEDGKHLWTYKYPLIGHGGSYGKVLATGGLIWVHNAKSTGDRHGWEGLDSQTGKVIRRVVEQSDRPMGHRCTYDTGTPSFIICGSFA